MKQVWVIAQKEFKEALQNKIFLVISGLFLIFSILSVYIGSTTKHAELRAYADTIALLKATGATAFPAKPEIFVLTILQNNVIYTVMVGALMAIFLGFDSFTKEKEHGNLLLILARPVFRDQLVSGKIFAGAMVIAVLQVLAVIFGLILLSVVGGISPESHEIIRLLFFSFLAFIYMLFFFLVAMAGSIYLPSAETSFLGNITFWLAVTYVIPQLADSQKTYAFSTNAALQATTQIPQATPISKAIELFSPTAHFETIGQNLLQAIPETAHSALGIVTAKLWPDLLCLFLPLVLVLFLIYEKALRMVVNAHEQK